MKYLKLLVVPLVLFFVGYVSGPIVGSILVSEAERDTTLVRNVKVRDMVFNVNLAEMRDSELPEEVKTEGQVKLPAVSGDGTSVLASGRTVRLLNRNGKKLFIETTDGLSKGEVDIDQTNIFDVIGRAMMDDLRASLVENGGSPAPAPQPAPVKPAPPAVATNNPSMPAVVPVKPVVADVVDDVPKPVIPEPTPEPVGGGLLTPEQIVEVMKASIKAGAVKEFKLAQVEAWKAGEEEDFGGEDFQTGLAAYKAETIFGVKTVQAKALIKGGKVTKWVYAKTGMEIR
jgi:hypothetical protein